MVENKYEDMMNQAFDNKVSCSLKQSKISDGYNYTFVINDTLSIVINVTYENDGEDITYASDIQIGDLTWRNRENSDRDSFSNTLTLEMDSKSYKNTNTSSRDGSKSDNEEITSDIREQARQKLAEKGICYRKLQDLLNSLSSKIRI